MQKIRYATKDFEINDLPTTRRQQFFDILKIRWRTLLLIGFFLLLFSLPLLITIIFKDIKIMQILSDESISDAEKSNQLFINQMFFCILYLPSMIIFFIGISGVLQIYKNIIYGEGVFFIKDFALGVKQNIFRNSIFAIIIVVLYSTMVFFANTIQIQFLAFLPAGIVLIIALPIIFIDTVYSSVYRTRFFRSILNSFILYIKKIVFYFLLYILLIAGFIVLHLEFFYISFFILSIKYSIFLINFLLLWPVCLLGWLLYNYYAFDELINIKNHQEIFKKGLNKID